MRFSAFNVYVRETNSVLAKNMLTGAVIRVPNRLFHLTEASPTSLESVFETYGASLTPFIQQGLVVENENNEFGAWFTDLMTARNDGAHRFSFHFLPTIQCQLRCDYCFENGGERGKAMKPEVLRDAITWLEAYLSSHKEIDQFRMILFGGEPLLRPDICVSALEAVSTLCKQLGIEFWSELVTNGEFLTEEITRDLAKFNWRRIQVTLDGPEEIHDTRRPGVRGRKTFQKIYSNLSRLLASEHIPSVDIRLSFDLSNCDAVISFLDELVTLGDVAKINLSLGFITDTFAFDGNKNDPLVAEKALQFWKKAKALGFTIPDTQFSGPLCVATAKHSAVLLPDGGLQKCFATAGRPEYNFSHITIHPKGYTQDLNFEKWHRMDDCIAEQCSYLPVCGGGCPNDAMVAHGGPEGGGMRYCQREFLDTMNKGLVEIAFGE